MLGNLTEGRGNAEMGGSTGDRSRPRRLPFIVGLGVVAGAVLLVCTSYVSLALQWAHQDAQVQARRLRLTEQAQEEMPLASTRPRSRVVVARTDVAANSPLDLGAFELRDVDGGAGNDVLVSLSQLTGMMLAQPAHGGYTISRANVYDPSELAATAEIVAATITPSNVKPGDHVFVSVTVKNSSDRPMRTMGAPPGFTYVQDQGYRTRGGQDAPPPVGTSPIGAWLVGVGNAGSSVIDEMPYRWSLGGELPPGATTTVTGQIQITRHFEATHFWAALIQMPNKVVDNGAGMAVITSLPSPLGLPLAR